MRRHFSRTPLLLACMLAGALVGSAPRLHAQIDTIVEQQKIVPRLLGPAVRYHAIPAHFKEVYRTYVQGTKGTDGTCTIHIQTEPGGPQAVREVESDDANCRSILSYGDLDRRLIPRYGRYRMLGTETILSVVAGYDFGNDAFSRVVSTLSWTYDGTLVTNPFGSKAKTGFIGTTWSGSTSELLMEAIGHTYVSYITDDIAEYTSYADDDIGCLPGVTTTKFLRFTVRGRNNGTYYYTVDMSKTGACSASLTGMAYPVQD